MEAYCPVCDDFTYFYNSDIFDPLEDWYSCYNCGEEFTLTELDDAYEDYNNPQCS